MMNMLLPEVQKMGDEQLLLGMQNLYQDMELAWALANCQNPKECYARQIIRAIKSDSYIMFHMKQWKEP